MFTIWLRKKLKFPRFPGFQFCSIPEIENLKILESFLLLEFLVVWESQNTKSKKRRTSGKRSITSECGLN